MPVRNQRPFKVYDQRKGEKLNYQHDFSPYEAAHGTSIVSAAVADVDTGITVAGSLTNSIYSFTATATSAGQQMFDLVGTFADGSIQRLLFRIDVFGRAELR